MKRSAKDRRQRRWALLIVFATLALAATAFGPGIVRGLRPEVAEPAPEPAVPAPAPRPAAEVGAEPGWENLEPVDRVAALFRPGASLDLPAPGGLGRLELPGNALERPAELSIVRYEVAGHPDPAGYALDLLPDGLEIRAPARLSLPLPQGVMPHEAEIVTMDPETGAWIPEPDQRVSEDGRTLVASLEHFSLRRIRIRPELSPPALTPAGRATLRLESDAGNTFQRYAEGRWRAVRRESASYRELMQAGRRGRQLLIVSGRLRAVMTGLRRMEVMRDRQRTVALPDGSPYGCTGWVLVHRLDDAGRRTGQSVVARVAGPPVPEPLARVGVVAALSRAAMEGLGLRWGRHMGYDPAGGEVAWVRVPSSEGEGEELAHLPVELEPYAGAEPEAASLPI